MLVVMVIIGLFVGLVGLNLFKQADQAKVTTARTNISTFMQALGLYKLDTGTYPATEQGLAGAAREAGGFSAMGGSLFEERCSAGSVGSALSI